MDDAVRDYIDAIAPTTSPCSTASTGWSWRRTPDATVVLSYKMPTYKVGRRLFLGVWKHGVSIYRFQQGRDGGFAVRHPELRTSKGTIQLRTEDTADIADEELRDLARAALDG